jgi:hypothetical protein
MNIIQTEVDNILQAVAHGKYLEILKKAKEVFIGKTGKIDEDAEEFESRMSSFNDWYLFHYQHSGDKNIVEEFLSSHTVDTDITESLLTTNYSLFLFKKINFRKQIIIQDILHGTKHILSKENGNLALVEDDIFIGRMAVYKEQSFLLHGLCLLPKDVLPILKKECKKLRKTKNIEEEDFLLNLERL